MHHGGFPTFLPNQLIKITRKQQNYLFYLVFPEHFLFGIQVALTFSKRK